MRGRNDEIDHEANFFAPPLYQRRKWRRWRRGGKGLVKRDAVPVEKEKEGREENTKGSYGFFVVSIFRVFVIMVVKRFLRISSTGTPLEIRPHSRYPSRV
jgi:hypothetical protein